MDNKHCKILLMVGLMVVQVVSEYISATITPSSLTINAENTYTFTLTRNINPITFDFITPVAEVPEGSKIILVMPDDFTTVSSSSTPSCMNSDTS